MCLLSKLWFAFLTMAITRSPTAVQGSLWAIPQSTSQITYRILAPVLSVQLVMILPERPRKIQKFAHPCLHILNMGKSYISFFLNVVIYIYIIYNQIYLFNSFESKYHVAHPIPLSNFRTFLSPLTESLHSLNANFPFSPPQTPGNHYSTLCLHAFDYSRHLINGIIQDLSFCTWLLSLSIMSVRFTHVVLLLFKWLSHSDHTIIA